MKTKDCGSFANSNSMFRIPKVRLFWCSFQAKLRFVYVQTFTLTNYFLQAILREFLFDLVFAGKLLIDFVYLNAHLTL